MWPTVRPAGAGQMVIISLYANVCVQQGVLAFSKAEDNQLWVPLVEKAYAKVRNDKCRACVMSLQHDP